MQLTLRATVSLLALGALLAPTARAGVITTRAAVATLLGPAAQTEGFGQFNPSPFTAYGFNNKVLDSTSIVAGRGPGLVNPGLTFSTPAPGTNMQWSGQFAVSNPSPALGFYLEPGTTARIDFATPSAAFGVDISNDTWRYAVANEVYTLTIYALDDLTVLDTFALNKNSPTFFGYTAAGGVGSFTLTARDPFASFVGIDDLLYSFASIVDPGTGPNPVPLPAAALAGLLLTPCCTARARRLRAR